MSQVVDLIQEPIGMALYEMKDGQISNACVQGGAARLPDRRTPLALVPGSLSWPQLWHRGDSRLLL